jgi:ribosomal protein S18 acetylase RimI-like enzyme
MERFAAGFRNPLIRGELCAALGHGRGVFRAFKNTLSRHPEAEKLWFSFKDKEMKREIIMWYNGLREEWGLEKIGVEPEETADLVLEDFRFRPFREEDFASAEKLHQYCQEEYKKNYAERGDLFSAEILINEALVLGSPLGLNARELTPSAAALVAESSGGEFAGFVSGLKKDSVLYIQCLEVKAEYRGLGIGEALLVRLLEEIDPNEVSHVLLDLPSAAEDFSRVLLREGFNPYAARYALNVRERGE